MINRNNDFINSALQVVFTNLTHHQSVLNAPALFKFIAYGFKHVIGHFKLLICQREYVSFVLSNNNF